MKTRIERWTIIDRLVFAACCGLVGLVIGWAIALFVARYIDTGLSSSVTVILIGLICASMGFMLPNKVNLFFATLWFWIKYWWS